MHILYFIYTISIFHPYLRTNSFMFAIDFVHPHPAFFTNNKVTPFLAGIPHKNRARASREPEKYPILQIKLPQSGNVPLCVPFQKA